MSGIFNVLSLILGVVAIVIPVMMLLRKSKRIHLYSNISLAACVLSIYCQICNYNRLVLKNDWSAMLDTSDFIVKISFLLIIITIGLNVAVYRKEK